MFQTFYYKGEQNYPEKERVIYRLPSKSWLMSFDGER